MTGQEIGLIIGIILLSVGTAGIIIDSDNSGFTKFVTLALVGAYIVTVALVKGWAFV